MDGKRKTLAPPCFLAERSNRTVATLFRREDPAAVLFEQWGACKDVGLTYSGNDTWNRMLQQGVQLLQRFAQDDRVRIRRPRSNQQIQFNRILSSGNNFVSYVDAIGELDGTPCVLEWKTTSARYPEEPAGISALDPQLVCYSWMTGIDEVAQIVFVRSVWLKFSICVQRLPTSSATNSPLSSTAQFDGSSPGCFAA